MGRPATNPRAISKKPLQGWGTLRDRQASAVAALVALGLWAWYRLDLLQPYVDVFGLDGAISRRPNALATVDHPWHTARFSLLLDALRDGHPLRWVASHQGGFPVEFNPVGSAVVDLLVWAVTLGRLPVVLVHTYAVGVVFLLPLAGFYGLGKVCRLSPWVAVLAGALHLCVRGWWWSGGSMELVEWGLVTNVAAATFLLLGIPLVVRLVAGWSRAAAAGLAVLLSLTMLTNPRSFIAIVALAVAVAASLVWHGGVLTAARRLAIPAALALGLTAPLLVPLLRYSHLYYFVEYSGYTGFGAWVDSSVQAVSSPVAVASVVSLVICLRPSAPRGAQVVGLTLVAYAALTVWLVEVSWPGGLADQLETTRLMPFQRLLMIAIAAMGAGMLLDRLASARASIADGALAATSVAVALLYVAAPPSFVPEGDRGLVRIGTFAEVPAVELEAAVRVAERESDPRTAILILGETTYWHDDLLAPTMSDRRFFYDDWLWYWQREHVGVYDPDTEHAYPNPATALEPAFLATHGIGAIVIRGEPTTAARGADWLTQRSAGLFDVYTVDQPTTLATIDGQPLETAVGNGTTIDLLTNGASGPLVVRTNWFPRWVATVDGAPVPVIHRPDGYLEVEVPSGAESVRLTYAVTRLDWLARLASITAALGVLGLLLGGLRPTARSGPRSASADPARTPL